MPTFIEVQDRVYDFVYFVIPSAKVVFADQDIKESELDVPYITLKLHEVGEIGTAYKSLANDSGEITISKSKEALLIVNYFGNDGMIELQALVDSLDFLNVKLFLKTLQVSIMTDSPVEDISAKFNEQTEKRAQVSFVVRYSTSQIDNVGVIESVEISPEYENTVIETTDPIIIDINP